MTKFVPLLLAHNGLAPELEATDDYVRVRMFRARSRAAEPTGGERA